MAAFASIQASSFAPASSASGDTLFTALAPEATGVVVENPYDDPHMWGRRYREYMGGAMGSGVAVGDYDGDGRVDLYVSTKTKPGRLFRNLGQWKFEDVTDRAGLALQESLLAGGLGWLKDRLGNTREPIWHQGATFADIDNDGDLDLYVCRNRAENLLFVNQGDGTFREDARARGLALVDGSVVGAFCDYDRDGWLDVLVLTNQMNGDEPAGRQDRLFRNDGTGRFVDVSAKAGLAAETFGHSATWFDYDNDGWPDLYIANDFAGPDHLYRNNRDGTFTDVLDRVVPYTSYSSMGADTADIDNDGHPDLFVADMATTSREKDRRGLAVSRESTPSPSDSRTTAPQYMRNTLFLNTGRGTFQEGAYLAGLAATDWTWSTLFEDFDNDGWLDLHVTNGMVREANNSDILNRMMRAESDTERIRAMQATPVLNEPNLAFRSSGEGRFSDVSRAWGLAETGVSFGAATGDFDQDGDLDLAYINYEGGVSLFRNDVAGQHRVQVRLRGKRSNRFGVGAVVRIESASGQQMRALTVSRGYASGGELVAHFGLGGAARVSRLTVEWPSGRRQMFNDLAADRAYVIEEDEGPSSPPDKASSRFTLAPESFGAQVPDESVVLAPDQEQTFLPFRTDQRGPAVAVGDVDGDGDDDVFLGASSASPARLLRWDGARYRAETLSGVPSGTREDGPALLLDFTGDGTRDLLLTKASARPDLWPQGYAPVIFANDGRGHFAATDLLPALAINVGAVCAADWDGDGQLDLFLGARSIPGSYPDAPRSVLLRRAGARFVDVTDQVQAFARLGLVTSAVARDVDGDGRPDLVVALEWDHVRYFRNEGGGKFADWTERAGFASGGRGWWTSVASADFNADGRPDFAVGNLGLNTPHSAQPGRTAVHLYAGDFAGNGTRLLIEAHHENGIAYPTRSRGALASRIPTVLRRFARNDDFARAPLSAIVGAAALESASRWTADQFASGVFLSQPDGTYRFRALPPAAQIAPVQGLIATDLDGDGNVDLAAVHNSFNAVPRFGGGVGVVLQGEGDGAFSALSPERSGFIVPGNAKALVALPHPVTQDPQLFLTRYGGSTALLAAAAAEPHWLSLRLDGPTGNPAAIGARVTLTFTDGSVRTEEIAAGGGWLSQSAPAWNLAESSLRRIAKASVRWPDASTTEHPAPSPQDRSWHLRR